MIENWFPRNYLIKDNLVLMNTRFAGQDWQIFTGNSEQNILVVNDKLAEYWFNLGIISEYFEKKYI